MLWKKYLLCAEEQLQQQQHEEVENRQDQAADKLIFRKNKHFAFKATSLLHHFV